MGGGWGTRRWRVSPPLRCSARDKPLLLYHPPCRLQIAALFRAVPTRPCPQLSGLHLNPPHHPQELSKLMRTGGRLGPFEAVLSGQVQPDGWREHSLGSGASVNSFVWDAAVSSKGARKKKRGEGVWMCVRWAGCLALPAIPPRPRASMKGGSQDWIESFHSLLSLVLFPVCLTEGETLSQRKVPFCVCFVWTSGRWCGTFPFFLSCRFFLWEKAPTAALKPPYFKGSKVSSGEYIYKNCQSGPTSDPPATQVHTVRTARCGLIKYIFYQVSIIAAMEEQNVFIQLLRCLFFFSPPCHEAITW